MTYEILEKNIIKWAQERGIFEKSNALKQIDKTQEELLETKDALYKYYEILQTKSRVKQDFFLHEEYEIKKQERINKKEVLDGIGDMLVTIIILAKMVETDSVESLSDAWEEIKDRKGKMIDGLFVKESV